MISLARPYCRDQGICTSSEHLKYDAKKEKKQEERLRCPYNIGILFLVRMEFAVSAELYAGGGGGGASNRSRYTLK